METILSSAEQSVTIGPDRPVCIIGERINPTGRQTLAAEMAAGDLERVGSDALAQVDAGATVLDVNAGIPLVDEPALLANSPSLTCHSPSIPAWSRRWPVAWRFTRGNLS
jgi:5-methyltetrahydrofolate--homocysteine methyltransferase